MRFFSLLFFVATACSSMAQKVIQATPQQLSEAYAQRTVVLYNKNQKTSRQLAEYYAKARAIPSQNLVGLDCSDAETISRAEYDSTIAKPLQATFTNRQWWKLTDGKDGKFCNQVVHRVFCIIQGVPLRIDEQPEYGPVDPKTKQKPVIPPTPGRSNAASVDSELMAFGLLEHSIAAPLNNPFYDKNVPFLTQPLAPFFVVSRIDGPTYEDAKRLIDDALAVEKTGLFGKTYIDLAQKNEAGYKEGEDWLLGSAKLLGASGFPLFVDARPERFPENYPMTDCAMYFGWYALPADGPFLNPKFRFKKGAVACHLHSFSATTVKRTTEGYVGLFISQGAAAVFGNVYEPFLSLTVHFDKLTDRLLKGFCLAEAHSMAIPGISWMTVCLGDPLYRPFAADLDKGTSDSEYRAMRKLIRDKGPITGANKELFAALEKEAAAQKSGTIYESLALITLGSRPEDAEASGKYLKLAAENYTAPADKIRVVLERAENLASTGQTPAAAKLVKTELPKYADQPESKAMEVRMVEWGGKK